MLIEISYIKHLFLISKFIRKLIILLKVDSIVWKLRRLV